MYIIDFYKILTKNKFEYGNYFGKTFVGKTAGKPCFRNKIDLKKR